MKSFAILALVLGLSVKAQNKVPSFHIPGMEEEEFEIVHKGDTTYYLKRLYEGLVGRTIVYDTSEIRDPEARIQVIFGFLQYTNDDNPAFPLKYRKKSMVADLDVRAGKIEIPDFYGNSDHEKLCELLGFSGNNDIIIWLESEDFEIIKLESLETQSRFFRDLLKHRETHEICCPEHIEQAVSFLKKDESEFGDVTDLGLELIYKQLNIVIKGRDKKGNSIFRVIVEKE